MSRWGFALALAISLAPGPAMSAEGPGLVPKKTFLEKVATKVGLKKSNLQLRREVRALRVKAGRGGDTLMDPKVALAKLKEQLKLEAADPHAAEVLQFSARNGNIASASDLHIGFGRTFQPVDQNGNPVGPREYAGVNAANQRQEDMMLPESLAGAITNFSKRPGNNTLEFGGDLLDFLEHVNPEDGLEKAKEACTTMIVGHTDEFKALAEAVVHNGLRVTYHRGNHDIKLAVPEIREYMIAEILRIGGIEDEQQKQTFRARVAYTGHMTPRVIRVDGTSQARLFYHDEIKDPSNSLRNQANSFSYTKDGQRVIPATIGDRVVRDVYVATETKNPDADNTAVPASKAVAHELLSGKRGRVELAKWLWDVSRTKVDLSDAQQLADRLDDRRVLRYWVERTGFDKMMNESLPPGEKPKTARQYAKMLESVYAQMPKPIHERMDSRLPGWAGHARNVLKMVFGEAAKATKEGELAEPKFLDALAETFKWIDNLTEQGGHDHAQRQRDLVRVESDGRRRELHFVDTSNFGPRVNGEDRTDFTFLKTDPQGRMYSVVVDAEGRETRLSRPSRQAQPKLDTNRVFEEEHPVERWEEMR
jgi:hypothetical protein